MKTRPLARLLLAAVLFWLVFSAMPAPPVAVGAGLDSSWIWGLNLANKAGMQFGRDIAFTYGPLGYLTVPIALEASNVEVLFCRGLIYAVVILALVRLTRIDWRIGLGYAVTVFLLSPYFWDEVEMAIAGMAASIYLVRARKPDEPDTLAVALVAFLTGASFLARLQQGVLATALLFGALWIGAPGLRRIWMLVLALASFLGLWLAKGQELSALPGFLRASAEIVSGYNEALAMPGPLWVVLMALTMMVGLFVLAFTESHRIVVVPVFVFAFMAFKHGFVRQDAHMAPVHLKLAMASLLAWAAMKSFSSKRWILFAGMTAWNLALGFQMTRMVAPYLIENLKNRITAQTPVAYGANYLDFAAYTRQRYAARGADLATHVLDPASRALIGQETVDVVPFSIDLIPANGLRWSPRPVFQSYSAYTPYLDERNAAHYRSSRRPEVIILHWDQIDGRHLWFDDPLTWREILSRYKAEGRSNQGLILRYQQDASLRETVLGPATEAAWDSWIDVPPSGPDEFIAAKILAAPSLLGRAMTQVLRGVPTMIDMEYADGSPALSIRTVRANLPSGPIVSVAPRTLAEASPALAGDWSALTRVRRIRFHTASPSLYQDRLRLQWISLRR